MLHADEKGIIHRDIKLGNIMPMNDHNLKLVDFGMLTSPDRIGYCN